MPIRPSHEEPKNIRQLPWFKEEDLDRMPGVDGVVVLPDVDVVLDAARDVFEQARAVDSPTWQDSQSFLANPKVREFLRSVMTAYHRLKDSASHTTVWCEWKDAHGTVCGAKMDMAVDAFGIYYRCQASPATHRRAV